MTSPTRREFMSYTGGVAAAGVLGLPPLEEELAEMTAEDLDRSSPMIFLRLDEIPGSSTTKGHQGEIDILSCRWGLEENARPGRGRASDPHRGHVTVLKAIDKATPALYDTGDNGKTIRSGTLTLTREGPEGRLESYLFLDLKDVQVIALETGQRGSMSFERCVLGPDEYSIRRRQTVVSR